MDTEKLLKYELPSWVEFISIDWMQTVIARYYAWKVGRKIKRYNLRLKREAFIRSVLDKNK